MKCKKCRNISAIIHKEKSRKYYTSNTLDIALIYVSICLYCVAILTAIKTHAASTMINSSIHNWLWCSYQQILTSK